MFEDFQTATSAGRSRIAELLNPQQHISGDLTWEVFFCCSVNASLPTVGPTLSLLEAPPLGKAPRPNSDCYPPSQLYD